MYCPYDGVDHPEGTQFSPEHIIPFALGGSNEFTIPVCSKSNSDFGAYIDARFLEVFPVSHERFVRNIKSYSGQEPCIVFRGTTELNGKTVKVTYEIAQTEKVLRTVPVVESEQKTDGMHYHIQASPDQVREILQSVNRKAARQGGHVCDLSGKPVAINDLLAKASVRESIPTIQCTWDYGEWAIAAQREFVKVALGASHFLLGESYSRSNDADRLRQFLNTPDQALHTIPITGSIWPSTVGNALAGLHRILGRGGDPDQHLVALLHMNGELVTFISFFGDINGKIRVAEDPTICGLVKPQDGFVLRIDPATRAMTRGTFADLLQLIAQNGDKEAGLS
jgi:hypothetical protein